MDRGSELILHSSKNLSDILSLPKYYNNSHDREMKLDILEVKLRNCYPTNISDSRYNSSDNAGYSDMILEIRHMFYDNKLHSSYKHYYDTLYSIDSYGLDIRLKTIRRVDKKMKDMENMRGYSVDDVEKLSRFCEIVGIQNVWICIKNSNNYKDSEYDILPIGSFINHLRYQIEQHRINVLKTYSV